MTAMSDYLETQLLNHLFRTGSYTKPTVLAVALCTVVPTDTHTGALTGAEVANAGSYARMTLNPLDANWYAVAAGNGTTSNTPAINFVAATADWSTVVGVAITDNITYGSGNLLFYGSLTGTKVVQSGDTFSFAPGQLSINIDN